MERSWLNAPRITDEYERGVEEFLQFAQNNVAFHDDRGRFRCPCVNCLNGSRLDVKEIREHLLCDGILKGYNPWIWHGESLNMPTDDQIIEEDDHNSSHPNSGDRLEDMIRDVGADRFEEAHLYEDMSSDTETPLYPGSKKFTRLSTVLKLMNLKALNGWSDKSFTELLQLLHDMLPDGNNLPIRNYEAKKILCPMGMEYKKIHACPNDCILYRKEYEGLKKCPKCDLSRYKVKDKDQGDDIDYELRKDGPPAKVMWYLSIIPRFKRLFANHIDAKHLRWHADERICDGMLRHLTDSSQWKDFDKEFPMFGFDPRNLRLGLATDGMNPYGNLSTNHSSWPVLLVIYNLPPGLCMKRKYMMLCMMISGPRQPGNDIDVYLSPLIDDLRSLWVDGVQVFDGFCHESFTMRAMLFCTINDFPAYGNLSRYSVKGHKACPVCEE